MTEHSISPITIQRAVAADIPAIAALFTTSFRDSVLHHCGQIPKPQAMEDVFTLVYEAEPEAALMAKTGDGKLAGYCFAPVRLPRLWIRAVFGGHLWKWAWRWITGQYGFGVHPVKVIIMNKLAFLRSAALPSKAANARILSIAVDENRRGKGIGMSLMQAAITYFQQMGATLARLEVRPDNTAAIKIYEKLGFIHSGSTFDSQGEWLIMMKEVD